MSRRKIDLKKGSLMLLFIGMIFQNTSFAANLKVVKSYVAKPDPSVFQRRPGSPAFALVIYKGPTEAYPSILRGDHVQLLSITFSQDNDDYKLAFINRFIEGMSAVAPELSIDIENKLKSLSQSKTVKVNLEYKSELRGIYRHNELMLTFKPDARLEAFELIQTFVKELQFPENLIKSFSSKLEQTFIYLLKWTDFFCETGRIVEENTRKSQERQRCLGLNRDVSSEYIHETSRITEAHDRSLQTSDFTFRGKK